MDYIDWVDYLRRRGLLSLEDRQGIVHMLRSLRPSVRAQGLAYCNRMICEHHDLWITYRAVKRIIEGVKI